MNAEEFLRITMCSFKIRFLHKQTQLWDTMGRASRALVTALLSCAILSNCSVAAETKESLVLVRGGSSVSITIDDMAAIDDRSIMTHATKQLDIVFSDLDGTLIHYPANPDDLVKKLGARHIIQFPPSSTGLVGVISPGTLRLCRDVREHGAKFVLVSGMRAPTLLKRIPYLPKADAYCCEAGGRIFYPAADETPGSFRVEPKPYFGAQHGDLEPFYLSEDKKWKGNMQRADAAGKDGFVGNELVAESKSTKPTIPISDRDGALWSHARKLQDSGFTVDTKGYASCFRVNRKQQKEGADFEALLQGKVVCPSTLSTSTNLGCVDFYPCSSGKKNCCDYLAMKFSSSGDDSPLANRCVCLCDDDNDIEMALACLHAYIPLATSDSMAATIRNNPSKFTLTASANDEAETNGTKATEKALSLILERMKADPM